MIGVGVGVPFGGARGAGPNLAANSTDFTQASWTKNGVTVTGTAPSRMEETAVTGSHEVTQAIAKPAVVKRYRVTVVAGPAERNSISLALGTATGGCWVGVNLSNGTNARALGQYGTAKALGWSARPDPANSGYYICTFEGEVGAEATVNATVQIYNATDQYLGVVGQGLNLRSATVQEL